MKGLSCKRHHGHPSKVEPLKACQAQARLPQQVLDIGGSEARYVGAGACICARIFIDGDVTMVRTRTIAQLEGKYAAGPSLGTVLHNWIASFAMG